MITDPLFLLLSRKFTIRELLRLKAVCKTFATLVSDNMQFTAQARCEDDTKDWYFPLRLDIISFKPPGMQKSKMKSWTWLGVHHSSGRIHRLPSMTHLARDEIEFEDKVFNCLLASTGGLLLFIHKYNILESKQLTTRRCKCIRSSGWRPLLVSNPLTKEWRVLPTTDCQDMGMVSWDYCGARAYMVVDEKANAYKVILHFRDVVSVYKSTSNCWSSWSFQKLMTWSWRHGYGMFVEAPSAIVGGKLYLTTLEVDWPVIISVANIHMLIHGHVSMYEVDEEEHVRKPPIQYLLRNYFPSGLHDNVHGFCIASYTFTIAKCMGGMYAIIPAYVNISLDVGDDVKRANGLHDNPQFKSYDDFGYLPLKFYILQLQGVGLPFGQLLIQISHGTTKKEHSRRKKEMWAYIWQYNIYENRHTFCCPIKTFSWFRCTTRGSVIWVAFADYLLQYDVVSGGSTTQILPYTSFGNHQDLSYRPSVHMRP